MHVLLAVDGSPQSLAAAKMLATLPFAERPQCTVVTALLDDESDIIRSSVGQEVRDTESEEARKTFEYVARVLSPVCTQVQHIIQRQHPSQLIVELGKELDVDLIVVGSVGHSALYRMTIGSTADYVANHARCSTLVARFPNEAAVKDNGPASVLIAHDGSATAETACHQLRGLEWPMSTKLEVLRMLPRPKLIPEDEVYDAPGIQEHMAKLEQLKADYSCGMEVTVSEAEDIPSGLYGLVQDCQPDLLFVGDSGKTAFSRFFLGSTSRYLLHHVSCPIWIARKKSW